ncbi:MAG: grxC [Alphaproteobacteria bacterium]|jgi:glutaredoxin 3|nr:grxC [Alphaproteobacteria bacterium]MDF3033523.1 grxC [Alphaproteobacteria bacterium]
MRYLASFLFVLMGLLTPVHALTVEIYTIPGCFGCGMAKSMLEDHGIPYTEVSIQGRPDLYAQMKKRAGGNPEDSMTVPRIFINDKHIGSYSELSDVDFDALLQQEKPTFE